MQKALFAGSHLERLPCWTAILTSRLPDPCDSPATLGRAQGIRHLARAVAQNASIESVFLDPSILSNSFGQKLARQLRRLASPNIFPGSDHARPSRSQKEGLGSLFLLFTVREK
jgi:hypothetical protein